MPAGDFQYHGHSIEQAHGWGFGAGEDEDLPVFLWAFNSDIAFAQGDTVAILGIGSTTTVAEVAPNVAAVRVLEHDPQLLARLEHNLAHLGLTNVVVSDMSLTSLDLEDEEFTKVLSLLALHKLSGDDRRAVIATAARVLVQGGELHVADVMRCLDDQTVDEYRTRVADDADLAHVLEQHDVYSLGTLIREAQAHGLRVLSFGGTTPLLGWARFAFASDST